MVRGTLTADLVIREPIVNVYAGSVQPGFVAKCDGTLIAYVRDNDYHK